MTHQTDPRAIESELERDRASLSSTLGELQDRVSIDNLAKEALGMIRSNAAAYTQSVDSAIRANPLALALTGAGIAWLVFGGKSRKDEAAYSSGNGQGFARHDEFTTHTRPESYRSPADTSWSDRIDLLRSRASTTLRSIERDARNRTDDLRDYASERAKVLADFTSDMKQSLLDGLEGLSDAARERIVSARENAYAARLRVQRSAREGGREVGRLIEEHPLVAGVVALALGAAFAATLPRTRTEDNAFGEESDRLMDAASDLVRQERARFARVAEGVADELKSSVRNAADAAADRVADLGEDVRDRAVSEAKKSSAG
ncbi:hypothetical protein DEA8626_02544 [Defluviimonas aquaemixtae]|uniref:DUF3618 domain-containing protein n=1 Tax=Albidovulum aquaemixtae TaxID=1542388 RepID=A0A2R8BJK7_9RHOB|nr:DUF3618 domain-containing protein [Defluviimonas aquaemixtae]SPH23481.1 hypothetical protein DEA8626_02544 [Defluviimonas aquaemixtae]